jgi:hypothetical protein
MDRSSHGARAGNVVARATFKRLAATGVVLLVALLPPPALARYVQQGPKLVGTPTTSIPQQGSAVAISADGNTAIVGAPGDNFGPGAAFIFVRSGGAWTQQAKLIGSGTVQNTNSDAGAAVAISADGNTAIMGGYADGAGTGAVWVFTRVGTTWTQQGGKLVGSNSTGASQGLAVAISGDGNTIASGGRSDGSGAGAVWIFVRANNVWSQQGLKLVGTGAVDPAGQGRSVALSSDGNTLIEGGNGDNSSIGAAWVFTRSSGTWSQQAKLVGSNNGGNIQQGGAIALSADGDKAIVSGIGLSWVFARSAGIWTQQGQPFASGPVAALSSDGTLALFGSTGDGGFLYTLNAGVWIQEAAQLDGSGADGNALQGVSVAMSADTNTMIVGGPNDGQFWTGASWIFIKALPDTVAHDFDGDVKSDILWRDTGGNVAMWLMNGGAVSSSLSVGSVATDWSIAGQRAFTLDGKTDILWRDNAGDVALWLMNAAQITFGALIANVPTTWSIAGTADFDGDNKADILWRDTSGNIAIWLMNGTAVTASAAVGNVPTSWSIAGTANFFRNYGNVGSSRIFWRDTSGNVAVWVMNGASIQSAASLGNVPLSWSIVGTGDFNADGNTDILWRDTSGNTAIWLLDPNGNVATGVFLGNVPNAWSIVATGDYDGDGTTDILWRDTGGNLALWLMTNAAVRSSVSLGNVPANWSVQSVNAD